MIMVNFDFLSEPVCFNNDKISVLCIENQKLYRNVCSTITNGETEENNIIFSKDFVPFKFKGNVFVVNEYLSLTYPGAVIKKFYEQIEIHCNNEQQQATLALKTHLLKYMESVISDFDYDFDFSYDINLTDVFKMMNLHPTADKNDILSNLIDYILIINKYDPPKCFVLFNLHLYFTKKELELFYKDIVNRHVALLVIENVKYFEKNKFEDVIIYDNDFCQIVEN